MNSKFLVITDLQRYRFRVFARCVLAIFAGFALATLTIPLLAYTLPMSLAAATYTGMLCSFVVWLLYVLFVFSCKSMQRIVCITAVFLAMMGLSVMILKLGAA